MGPFGVWKASYWISRGTIASCYLSRFSGALSLFKSRMHG